MSNVYFNGDLDTVVNREHFNVFFKTVENLNTFLFDQVKLEIRDEIDIKDIQINRAVITKDYFHHYLETSNLNDKYSKIKVKNLYKQSLNKILTKTLSSFYDNKKLQKVADVFFKIKVTEIKVSHVYENVIYFISPFLIIFFISLIHFNYTLSKRK